MGNEAGLAKHIIEWLELQHWDVYQEVQFGLGNSRADIAAVRNGYLWIVETKMSLTFTVLEQASRWHCDFRSIAIPESRNDRMFQYSVVKDHHVGVIENRENRYTGSYIDEVCPPKFMREYHEYSKRMIQQLLPAHKTSLAAGSSGGGYHTPYKATMDNVKLFIRSHPNCTLKEIMTDLKHHYASNARAKTCIRVALENWESNWCKVTRQDNGILLYSIK